MAKACKAVTSTGAVLVAAALLLSGCHDVVNLDNAGYACLSPDGEVPGDLSGLVFPGNTVLYATVVLADCLSSSCDTNREAECSITVSGDQIIIESQGSYTDESGMGSSCTEDCHVLEATCQTAGPVPYDPEGDPFTVTYGGESISFRGGATAAYCVPPQR